MATEGSQYGGRPDQDCQEPVVDLVRRMEARPNECVAFIDIAKAYDTIDRRVAD